MKQKNSKKMIKRNALRQAGRSRNYVRRSFSRKAISFTGAAGTGSKIPAENKPHLKSSGIPVNKSEAQRKDHLRLVPKPAVSSVEQVTAAPAEKSLDNSGAVSTASAGGRNSGSDGGSRWNSPRASGLIATALLLIMLITAVWSANANGNAGSEPAKTASSQTGSLQLSKEYIYAGSRMLAIEDYGISSNTARTNVALASNGGVAYASSELYIQGRSYPVTGINNGDRKGINWESTGGWADSTPTAFPDWVQINFNGTKSIDEINVFTIQDDYQNPVEPTESLIFSQFGITAFDVQYWNGSNWTAVPNGNVTNNNKVWSKFTFSPIATNAIRVQINNALADYCRLIEVEAFGTPSSSTVNPPPTSNPTPTATPTVTPTPTATPTLTPTPTPSRINYALASSGSTATASSADPSYLPSNVINGNRMGANLGVWVSLIGLPQWLEVGFGQSRTIDEINVFTVQDDYLNPVEPTLGTVFTSTHANTGFDVQYWDGSGWVNIASVTGNNKVWRQFTFAPVTTTKIRVSVTATGDNYAYLTEVEAWGNGN